MADDRSDRLHLGAGTMPLAQVFGIGAVISEAMKAPARSGHWSGTVSTRKGGAVLVTTYNRREGDKVPPEALALVHPDGRREPQEVNLD
jgi:hypothetical protein